MLKERAMSPQSLRPNNMNTVEELTLALARANRALAQSTKQLAQSQLELAHARESLKHETIEREMAEESLMEAMTGKRTFHWYATIFVDPVLGDNMLKWDLRTANEEVVKRWLLIAYEPGEDFQAAFSRAVYSGDRQKIHLNCQNALAAGDPGYVQEFRLITADGDMIWVKEEVTIDHQTSNTWSLTGKCTDITTEKRREEQAQISDAHCHLQSLAFQDELTGLNNRRALQDRLVAEFERAIVYKTPLSVIILDVDNFKEYNDTYGHPEGDVVLQTVARLMRENARGADFAARFGGEEFIIVTPADQEISMIIAERICAAFNTESWPNRPVTVSVGVATYLSDREHSRPEVLIAEADDALYLSKSNGKNRVTHARPSDGGNKDVDCIAIDSGVLITAETGYGRDMYHAGGAIRFGSQLVDTKGVANAAPRGLYQSERTGNFTYDFPPVSRSGLYLVRLHFAETEWSHIGDRIFDIRINGAATATNFDILAEAGRRNRALVKDFPVAVKAGAGISLSCNSQRNGASLCGLEVVPVTFINNVSINCGGLEAGLFLSDRYHPERGNNIQSLSIIPNSDVLCDVDLIYPNAIYRCVRFGDFDYRIPGLPPGAACLVALHFTETNYVDIGRRVFDVAINQAPVLSNFDILAETKVPFVPIINRFFATANEDGEVVIDFKPIVDNALVAAIEVFW